MRRLYGSGIIYFLAAFGFLSTPIAADAATATLSGAQVTKVLQTLDTLRGANGRAYIAVDRTFPLAGVCQYSGAVNAPSGWMMELDAQHASFKSMMALALTAYSTGRSVEVIYDDAFGAGTTCRVIALQIED